MPVVFISHSSGADGFAAQARERVRHQLTGQGWDVFVDADVLEPGDDWNGIIYTWLADCDAAVFIIGSRAIASTWVRRELNLLLWRRDLGSPITLIPVLLADVSEHDVQDSELSELLAFQFIKQAPGMADDAAAQELAGRVAGGLPDISSVLSSSSDRDDMRQWLSNVASCLRAVKDEASLRTAVRALGVVDNWHFPSIREGHRYLASQMLAPGLSGHVYKAVMAIARQASHDLDKLVNLITPTWVDGDAARLLLPHGRQVFAILNARLPDTATHYVQRAACCSLNYRTETVTLILGEEQQLEFERDCEAAVRRLLDLPTISRLDDGEALDEEEPLDGEVGFLVVDPDETPMDDVVDVLRPLLSRFQWLNVILLTGESCPDPTLIAQWGMGGVVLRPELAAREEHDADRTVRRMMDLRRQLGA
jgi:TIR domain-containing protein